MGSVTQLGFGSLEQDELVQALRSEGRRQAAQRMLRQKRSGGSKAAAAAEDAGTDPPSDA